MTPQTPKSYAHPESVEQQVQRLCNRLNSDDPDHDDCDEAARMLRYLGDFFAKHSRAPSPEEVDALDMGARLLNMEGERYTTQGLHKSAAQCFGWRDTLRHLRRPASVSDAPGAATCPNCIGGAWAFAPAAATPAVCLPCKGVGRVSSYDQRILDVVCYACNGTGQQPAEEARECGQCGGMGGDSERQCPGCMGTGKAALAGFAPSSGSGEVDPLDCIEFYDLMQAYRHAPIADQVAACAAYDAVRRYIRALSASAGKVTT